MDTVKITVLLLLTSSLSGYSQVKCKLQTNETDSFTGQHIVITKWINIGSSDKGYGPLSAQLTKKGDSTYVLRLWAGGGGLGCITTSSQVHFKTVLGEIQSIKHDGDIDCGSSTYVYGTTVKNNPIAVLVLDQHEVEFLKKSITMARMEYDNIYGNYTITMPMNLQQLFTCVDSAGGKAKK
jgi:hypothetical protein